MEQLQLRQTTAADIKPACRLINHIRLLAILVIFAVPVCGAPDATVRIFGILVGNLVFLDTVDKAA